MLRSIGQFLFTKIFRWSFEGTYPGNEQSFVLIVAPHTSMWDVPIGLGLKWWYDMQVSFYVKEEMFFFPLKYILKTVKAIPIKRSGNTNFVAGVVADFKNHGNRRILITPEGTRKKVNQFKSGYYYIAKGAGVPILPTIFDFEKKTIIMLDLFYPSGEDERDLRQIEDMFRGYKGKHEAYSF